MRARREGNLIDKLQFLSERGDTEDRDEEMTLIKK
jgi:hypothetical protein